MSRRIVIALALLLGCSGRDREPAAHEPIDDRPSDATTPERAPLVTLELGLVDDAVRQQLVARLDPSSPLVEADALLAVHHHIAAPWHIYWLNPGDSGLRTRLSLDGTGLAAGLVVYPGPDRFVADGGQVSYGWERDAVLFVPLDDLGADARVQLRSDWLACHESCIPGHTEIAATIAELPRRDDPITRAMLERIPEPAGDRLRASWADGKLRVEPSGDVQLLEFFPYVGEHAAIEATVLTANALEIDYRFDASPPAESGQGVVAIRSAGEARWLELAVAWPNP